MSFGWPRLAMSVGLREARNIVEPHGRLELDRGLKRASATRAMTLFQHVACESQFLV